MKIAIIIALIFIGCEFNASHDPAKLPPTAENIKQIGNGWVTFTYNNQKFLYHRSSTGHEGYESLTKIDGN